MRTAVLGKPAVSLWLMLFLSDVSVDRTSWAVAERGQVLVISQRSRISLTVSPSLRWGTVLDSTPSETMVALSPSRSTIRQCGARTHRFLGGSRLVHTASSVRLVAVFLLTSRGARTAQRRFLRMTPREQLSAYCGEKDFSCDEGFAVAKKTSVLCSSVSSSMPAALNCVPSITNPGKYSAQSVEIVGNRRQVVEPIQKRPSRVLPRE